MTKRILAVDDSAAIRQAVGYTLRAAGYSVTEAVDGVDAAEKAEAARFDLVLTDLNMPRMDGLALIARLRGRPEYRRVPILVLSTESSGEAKARGRAAGASGWLVKPFEPARLLEVAARVLG
ncbi:response regulator [Pseudothauera nasutitermitis]|uniref:Response regulator n=1 Tax=Pseudothauera nasutitermitis TaxID=2565930 RepID=A0A4S4B1V1_9RHOO|nr:response regulator [Pseudothauera nasutitermitis]THF66506.1 response regulator [Pseudothauera nasutitermitis]